MGGAHLHVKARAALSLSGNNFLQVSARVFLTTATCATGLPRCALARFAAHWRGWHRNERGSDVKCRKAAARSVWEPAGGRRRRERTERRVVRCRVAHSAESSDTEWRK